MLFIDLSNNDDHEEVELTIGQLVEYLDSEGSKKKGEVLSANPETGFINVRTGDIIKYIDYIHVDDLIL